MSDPDSIITVRVHNRFYTFINGVWSMVGEPEFIKEMLLRQLQEATRFAHNGRHSLACDVVCRILEFARFGRECIVKEVSGYPTPDYGVDDETFVRDRDEIMNRARRSTAPGSLHLCAPEDPRHNAVKTTVMPAQRFDDISLSEFCDQVKLWDLVQSRVSFHSGSAPLRFSLEFAGGTVEQLLEQVARAVPVSLWLENKWGNRLAVMASDDESLEQPFPAPYRAPATAATATAATAPAMAAAK